MRKSLLLIPVLAAIAAISACGNSGEKGRVLARIASQTFTEGDLDLRLSVHDDIRRGEILANPELRRAEFEGILRTRLHALGGLDSKHGKSKDLQRRLASLDQRVFTQYYFETYLGIQGGMTRAQIEAYYNANAARFTDDSGRTLSLGQAHSRIVDSLIVQKGAIDSFFQANGGNYRISASAEASLIRTATRAQADAALKALRGGQAFGAVAKRYSIHDSKNADGKLGVIKKGVFTDALGSQATLDSLLFDDSRLKPGQTSGIVPIPGGFNIVRVEAYTAEKIPSLNEVGEQVRGDFVRDYKAALSQNAVANLKAIHEVRLVSQDKEPTDKEVQAYYNQHKAEYESPETFEVYHIEAADEQELAAAVDRIKDLESFKALAGRISSNEMTRAQHGYVGVIKRDFSLPYGIGMMPSLYPALDEVESGKIGELVQNPASQTWHAFWLVKKMPPTAKPIDRVRPLVIQDLKANRIANVQPSDTLAIIGKSGKAILERDVLFLRREIPDNIQERYTRENLAEFLIIWEIFTAESKNLGLDKERKSRAQRMSSEDNFWAGVYRDSVLIHTWEEKPSALEKTFKANRALFTRDSSLNAWKPLARDIAAFHLLTNHDFEIEYNTNPDRYTRDSLMIPFDEAKPAVFEALKPVAYARLDAAVLEKLKKRFKVRIEDEALMEPSLEPAAVHYKKAQDLHYERKLDQAMNLYERLRVKFPANDGLQDSISFGIAQIYIEQERYAQALAEYRRVNYLYPKSPNDYKAMFMIGFIQAEHMRRDSAAVRSFESMLKKYPESDLSDDADWMIRNIRSGGQLMPVLEEDLDEDGMSKESGQ